MQALFLGAGASYDCGMPLVTELTAELRRWLTKDKLSHFNNIWRDRGGGWSDESISTLLSLLENRGMHYENVVGAIEVNFLRERDEKKRMELHGIYGFLLQAVRGLLLERQVKNFSFAMNVLDDFVGIKKLIESNRPLWAFSINHDVILELLAAKFSIPIKSGFRETIQIKMATGDGRQNDVNFERLSREAVNNSDYDFFKLGETGINLIKLHGSMDIFGQGDELNYLKLATKNGSADSYIEQLQLINAIDLSLGRQHGVRAVNEHTYIDSVGEIQFLRNSLLSGVHKFSPRIQQIAPPEFMSLFGRYLNHASELVCIGYGFGDTHINESMADWLSQIHNRKLTVVSPGIKDYPTRFGHLCNQISLVPLSADEYFLQLHDDTGCHTQNLMRKIRTKNRKRMMTKLLSEN